MPPRSPWIVAIALALLLALVPSAWAGDPPTAQQTIVSADFNSDAGGFALAEIPSERPARAYWGRITNVRRGTSGYSLWCAGTQQYPTLGPSTFFPLYPAFYDYVQQTREPIKLTSTNPTALTFQGPSAARCRA